MKILKKIAMKLREHKKLLFMGAPAFCVLVIASYLVISLFRVTPAEIALSRLESSYQLLPVCHEQCSLERSGWEKTIVNDLKKNKKRIAQRLEIDWRNQKANVAFKIEIIHILNLANGADNPPGYIIGYISEPSAKPQIMREIIARFSPSAFARYNLEEILTSRISQATTSEEKLDVIKTLSEINNDGEIGNYFALLDSSASTEIRREAIKSISATRQKSTFFNKEQLAVINKIALASETEAHLRQDLVFLLGDYYLVYPTESLEIWQAIYDDSSLDSISRAYSADNINHLASKELVVPEVSATDWDNYYNK